jgi:hypothetical protein
MDIRWQLSFNRTSIDILPDDDDQIQVSLRHTLLATAILSGVQVSTQLHSSILYRCSTDRCNDLDQLKRLMQSLTLINNLIELDEQLESSLPFDGHWCVLSANQTDTDCAPLSDIDPATCKQCFAKLTSQASTTKVCASCITTSIEQDAFIETNVLFNIDDRTRSQNWSIYCQAPNCNALNTGDLIHQKSTIIFDFNRFFNQTINKQQRIIPSTHEIGLLLSLCLIQYFY